MIPDARAAGAAMVVAYDQGDVVSGAHRVAGLDCRPLGAGEATRENHVHDAQPFVHAARRARDLDRTPYRRYQARDRLDCDVDSIAQVERLQAAEQRGAGRVVGDQRRGLGCERRGIQRSGPDVSARLALRDTGRLVRGDGGGNARRAHRDGLKQQAAAVDDADARIPQQPHQQRVRQDLQHAQARGAIPRRHEACTEHRDDGQASVPRQAAGDVVEDLRRVGPIIEDAAAPGAYEHVAAGLDAEVLLQLAGAAVVRGLVQHLEKHDFAAWRQAHAQPFQRPEPATRESRRDDPVLVGPAHAPGKEPLAARGCAGAHVHDGSAELLRAAILRHAARTVEHDDVRPLALQDRHDLACRVGRRARDRQHRIRRVGAISCVATEDEPDRAPGPATLDRAGDRERTIVLAGATRPGHRDEQELRPVGHAPRARSAASRRSCRPPKDPLLISTR